MKTPTSAPSTAAVRTSWRQRWLTRRRLITWIALIPATALLFFSVGATGFPLGWTTIVAATAVIASGTVASYVAPTGAGAAIEWGCGRCAIMAGISLPMATIILALGPGQVSNAAWALLVALFGLGQRLRDPGSCTT